MDTKKKILFVIESLSLGGAEKSLVTLLNLMDYSKYDVDLLLLSQGGPFQELLPQEVKLLDEPDYFQYTKISWESIALKISHPQRMVSQLRYSIGLRTGKYNHIQKSVMLWKTCHKCIAELPTEYDAAIAYAQGVPTFYVADKVKAKKKAAWINVTYKPEGNAYKFISPYYDSFDVVNAVSESVRQQIKESFGIPDSKIMVMRDILDVQFALKMAKMDSGVVQEMDYKGIKILTVGRLANMKGHDMAIEAARVLREKNVDFKWYAVGDGPEREKIEFLIREYHLENTFILLGARSNPYPYFNNCDVYVQPSRFEGFGITLAEAKMFSKPIVTTNFDAVGAQFVNEKNSLIVDISADAIADGIIRMLSEEELRNNCVTSLRNEKLGNQDEMDKLYKFIEG